MQVARTHSPSKVSAVKRIEDLAKEYSCLALSRLHKVRAAQLMALRRGLRGHAEILVAKNRIARIALSKVGFEEIQEFTKNLEGQNAFIFTNTDPFRLFITLEKNRVNLPARAGDVATDDVAVPAGNTGLPPGPVLSEFKAAGVPTRIDTGSIWITRDTVVAKRGDQISLKLAGLLARLGIKPIRAGLSVFVVYWNHRVLFEGDVKLDLDAIKHNLRDAYRHAHALSLEASYPTMETVAILLSRGQEHALALAISSKYLTKETATKVLGKAETDARFVYALAKRKGYA